MIFKNFHYLLLQIKSWWIRLSPDNYFKYLRSKGVKLGENVRFYGDIGTCRIDVSRPTLVSIGNNVALNQNFTLMTHDYGTFVFRRVFKDFISSSGRVSIGNNIVFGSNVTVLKGVSIGDNCIIGANSVVTKSIPPNSVVVGIPAKRICSIEEYYKQRQKKQVEEAIDYARSILERLGRPPRIEDFHEEFVLWLHNENNNSSEDFPKQSVIKRQVGSFYNEWMENHYAPFKNFNDFLEKVNEHDEQL